MDDANRPTRERLVTSAAQLFRQKGYHATGLTEVLLAAQAPKGSLYYYFPEGKADLARAAADWTADLLVRIFDDAFGPATDWQGGVTTLCHKLARLFDLAEDANACPISALLFDGPEDADYRAHAEALFARLVDAAAAHAARLGEDDPKARAEMLLILIEGGWTMARVQRRSDVLRRLPDRMFGPGLRIPHPATM